MVMKEDEEPVTSGLKLYVSVQNLVVSLQFKESSDDGLLILVRPKCSKLLFKISEHVSAIADDLWYQNQ